MIQILGYILFSVYVIALIYITLFCLMQFQLLYHYRKHKSHFTSKKPLSANTIMADLPFVTIQLPIYNERYVVERLIENMVEIDYPKDKYEIHVIDDSTDITKDICLAKVKQYKQLGYNIEHITRKNRIGYKAGALKDATPYAKGEFIAIFDADFLPKKNFIRSVLPYFESEKVGVVQTRWEHINQDYSLLTKLQAFQLNVHFTVEQKGRDAGNYMLQFNGTAGMWRKEAIIDAGGWEADTLTEDLDLSYRAQLKGWKIVFREDIGSPAELPAEMNGLKSQQFRWMKGGAETAKKMLPTIWKSDLNPAKKLHATMHLMSSTVFLFIFILGVFSVPILFYIIPLGINKDYLAIFMLALASISVIYMSANIELCEPSEPFYKKFFKTLILFPVFLSLSMGLSLHNSIAVIQGYFGKKSAFIRTPKFNIKGLSDSFSKRDYFYSRISKTTIVEGLLAIYFACGIVAGIIMKDGSFLFLHILLLFGYSTIFYYSIKHIRVK